MRFLLDACADARLLDHLTACRHDATRVGRDYPGALTDEAVLGIAFRERRILITDDRDFGELVLRLRRPHAGVIYLRLNTTRIDVRIARLDHVLDSYADALDRFLVVGRDDVRIAATGID